MSMNDESEKGGKIERKSKAESSAKQYFKPVRVP